MSSSQSINADKIKAFGATIQMRNNELQELKLELQQVQETVNQTKELVRDQSKLRRETRASLLRHERAQHGLELELYHLQDQYESSKEQLEGLLRDLETKQDEYHEGRDLFEATHCNVYAPHAAMIALHRERVQAKLDAREETKRARETKLEQLQQSATAHQQQTMHLQEKVTETRYDLQKLLREEQERDESMGHLDEEIKNAIRKRTSMRHAFQDAKESFQTAQDEAMKWEQAVVDSSNAGVHH